MDKQQIILDFEVWARKRGTFNLKALQTFVYSKSGINHNKFYTLYSFLKILTIENEQGGLILDEATLKELKMPIKEKKIKPKIIVKKEVEKNANGL
jgi:hypothetical protein